MNLDEIYTHLRLTPWIILPLSWLEAWTLVEDSESIRLLVVEPGADVVVSPEPLESDCRPEIHAAFHLPEDSEFWVDEQKVPLRQGSIFLFNAAARYRMTNRSTTPRLHMIVRGRLNIDDPRIVACARQQNRVRDHRHALNLLLGQVGRKGGVLNPDSKLYLDLVNIGTRREMLPQSVALGLNIRPLDDELLQEEAQQVSLASLYPMVAESFPLAFTDEWLRKKLACGKAYAVVLAAGTFLSCSLDFMIEVLRIIAKMERTGAAVVGQIINKSGQLPHLHEQFFVVGLQSWARLGCPSFEVRQASGSVPAFVTSGLNWISDFTPSWMEKAVSAAPPVTGKADFGTEVLAAALQRGDRVENISPRMREIKDYMNPRQGRGENYRRVRGRVQKYVDESQRRVFVFNTEELRIQNFKFEPDMIISPCAGVKPFSLFRQFGQGGRSCRFLFIENNPNALRFYRSLLSCGGYSEILAVQRQALSGQGLGGLAERAEVLMETLIGEAFGGKTDEFMRCFKAVARAASFIEADYHLHHESICARIGARNRVLFWHSNAWESNPAMYRFTAAGLKRNYRELVARLGAQMGTPAWIHKAAFAALLGPSCEEPQIVFTDGAANGFERRHFERLLTNEDPVDLNRDAGAP